MKRHEAIHFRDKAKIEDSYEILEPIGIEPIGIEPIDDNFQQMESILKQEESALFDNESGNTNVSKPVEKYENASGRLFWEIF